MLADADHRLGDAEAATKALDAERAKLLAEGQSSAYRQAIDILTQAEDAEGIEGLRRSVKQTRSDADDTQLARIEQIDGQIAKAESEVSDLRAKAADLAQRFPISTVVHNAGVIRPRLLPEVRQADLTELAQLHLGAAILLVQAALPGMRERRYGRIVLISSMNAIRSQDGAFVVAQAMMNRDQGETGWRFMTEHCDELLERFPDNSIVRMLDGIVSLSRRPVADEIPAFFEAHHVPDAGKRLDQALERLQIAVRFRERETGNLVRYLETAAAAATG